MSNVSSTLRLCDATASQAGSMRGSRRKTAQSVLRVVSGRAGVPDNKGRLALLYTLLFLAAIYSATGVLRSGGSRYTIKVAD